MMRGTVDRRRKTYLFVFFGILALVGSTFDRAWSASSNWFETSEIGVRLVTTADSIAPGRDRLLAGLHLKMAEGWKVYWRTPGEAGLPPKLDWRAADNIAEATVRWPAPSRFDAFGIENYGYKDEVVLPLDLALARPGQPVSLTADVFALVCRELCIPVDTRLQLEIPQGDGAIDAETAQLIDRFRARVPDDGTVSGISVDRVSLSFQPSPRVVVEALSSTGFDAPEIFLENPEVASWSAPTGERLSDGRWRFSLDILAGELSLGDEIQTTIVDGPRAMTSPPRKLSDWRGEPQENGRSIWMFLGFALIGGLILNVMPCVLPVLALKLATVLDHNASGIARVRWGFLVTAAGILAAMLVLALATATARAAGMAVGWGLQFQNPVFLAFMALIVGLFAANLFGRLEIALPAAFNTSLALAGGRQGWFGDFATGAFATLLATPCSAPFLGTAVGFALSGDIIDIFAIFAALGLGLALPYLLIALFPRALRWLPKPGLWMNKVRWLMGLALAATCVWLLSVLAAVVGTTVSAIVGLSILVLVGLLGGSRFRKALNPRFSNAAAAVLGLFILALPMFSRVEAGGKLGAAADWRIFDEAAIGGYVAGGRSVFVDVTADWCITCKANKALVVDRGPVAERLESEEIVPMQADWTRPDDTIARYLQRHGRYGIPFNIVYGPGAPEGIVLPELLSEDAVLRALDEAAG